MLKDPSSMFKIFLSRYPLRESKLSIAKVKESNWLEEIGQELTCVDIALMDFSADR